MSSLLEYRLPAWSYRLWDVSFGLDGGGHDASQAGNDVFANRFATNLGSIFSQNWESEVRDAGLHGQLSGAYSRSHSGSETGESTSRYLRGDYNVLARWRQYLGRGPFYAAVSGRANRTYSERLTDRRSDDEWTEADSYQRTSLHDASSSLGWGRTRNVVPLLRAKRLSERLTALGRSPLSAGQIQDMAQVLAKEYGYRAVFDRTDRHFWEDVLAPILDEGRPLTPYEVFYLADILNEDLGDRYQGFRVEAGFRYFETTAHEVPRYQEARTRSPHLSVAWSHNPTLTQQIGVDAVWEYQKQNSGERWSETAYMRASLTHLWNLADRYRLDTAVSAVTRNDIDDEIRRRQCDVRSVLQVYLEDQVSLQARVGAAYQWDRHAEEINTGWSWSYSLGLTYHLDRLLS